LGLSSISDTEYDRIAHELGVEPITSDG
jgi:hypothetical protein